MKSTDKKVNIKGIQTFTTRDKETGEILRQQVRENIVTTLGREMLARRMAGNTTYTGAVDYGALGTDTTVPANTDTTLGSESTRVTVTSQDFAENIAYISFFFPAPAADIGYEEFGNFVDGGAGADTGQMFSHVLISGTIATTETLTVDCQYTIT